ncbi:reverse transcriptase domain-containing protein [Tanacetum coccineum]
MGRNLEAYVDDMVIKSKTKLEMIKDIEETLLTLKKVNMKLNLKKCSFGIEEGKFLGYIVTSEGIRANPEKAKAIVNMPSPTNLKQMQRLSSKLAALNRFISKAAEKALPCLYTLKRCTNKKDFHWTTEAEEAFQEMKKLIAELPILTAPKMEEELMVYLSAASEAVSAVLLVENKGKSPNPLLKQNATRRHTIKAITDKPISHILNNREATGILAKWGTELEAYGIKYAPRSVIKGQVLADFLADTMAEHCSTQIKASEPNDTLAEGKSEEEQEAPEAKAPKNLGTKADLWKLYTDGASNEHRSGASLLAGLRIAAKMKVEKMHAFVDSKLVASQVEGSYEAKGEKTKKYKEKALEMICSFNKFQISHILREDNKSVDALCKLAAVQCEG